MSNHHDLVCDALGDPDSGWSIGTFGAVGEFMREPGEPCTLTRGDGGTQLVTARGGIRVRDRDDVRVLAYETFSSDGETWGNEVAFCLPRAVASRPREIRCLGADREALPAADRDALLFDIGVGIGEVRMCVRTRDEGLLAALAAAEGADPLSPAAHASNMLILKVSPTRVLLSPLARIEVHAPIPPPDGRSPVGPHTHLFPRQIAAGRTHSANAPIPEGLQPVLMLHPRSPWRDPAGQRTGYDAARARAFDAVLARFGLPEALHLRAQVESAVREGGMPRDFPAASTRRGRMQLRILLRRLAQELGPDLVQPWRELHDRHDPVSAGGPHEVDVATA